MKVSNYIKNICVGVWHLGQGMYVTMLNFCRPKVTRQYPENRGEREYGVAACPTGAIRFTNEFEHAVFTRERLLLQLNRPGSSQAPAPAPKPASPAREGAQAPGTATVTKTE